MNRVLFHLVAATTFMLALNAFAQGEAPDKSSIAPIRVQGRHLVDPKGNCVRLMGVMQSIHPFFNCGYWGGGSDDAAMEMAWRASMKFGIIWA